MLRSLFDGHTADPSFPHDCAGPAYLPKTELHRGGDGVITRQTAAEAKTRPSADRILGAALEMTDQRYDTFQIRAVAHRAHVSPGTLYRYFPSKDELLVACLHLWLTELVPYVRGELNRIKDPVERIRHTVARITRGITERPLLAAAFVRSYLIANAASSGPDIVRTQLCSLFAHAAGCHQSDRNDASELLTDIWSVNMPALLQGRIGFADLQSRMDRSVTAVGLGLPVSTAEVEPSSPSLNART
ncbi:TetR/AcrR family transcriptional regulator [Mycobacterium sp. NPDC003323]